MIIRSGSDYPSARVRMLGYLPQFEEVGDDIRWMFWRANSRAAVAHDAARLLRLAQWADVVLVQRPNQPVALLRALASVNPRIVVDFDDALWVGADGGSSGEYAERLLAAIQLARVVIPGSDFLASWVRENRPGVDVRVIRSAVDTRHLVQHRDRTDLDCIVGWIGTPGNLRDLNPILEALRAVTTTALEGGGRCRLRVISSEPLTVRGLNAEFALWSPATEASSLAGLDIGLMPLHDDLRSRGRCGYKAIQYMAASVPAVVTPIGSGKEVVTDRVTGRWAVSQKDWEDALLELATDARQRQALGTQGRAWVDLHASMEATFVHLRAALVSATV